MKKLFVLLGLIFFLTSNIASAINIDNETSVITINGTTIYKSSIERIDYSSMDGVTKISLKDGTILSFYTNYNEYSQIDRAYHTVMVATQTYITPYYSGYNVYSQPAPVVYANPVVYPRQMVGSTVVVNAPSYVSYNNHSGYPIKNPRGENVPHYSSNMPMAPANPVYAGGNPVPHYGAFPGHRMI